MSDPARPIHRTADDFIAWAMDRPDGKRWELAAGELVAMAPERVVHARIKFHIAKQLEAAVHKAGLNCEVFTDGMAVQVDETTVYEPDALVRCGPPLADDEVKVTDPVVVVEVTSPSSRALDTGAKLADYMRIPTVRDYLIISTKDRIVIHHAPGADGIILTRIVRDSSIDLAAGFTLENPFPARG